MRRNLSVDAKQKTSHNNTISILLFTEHYIND